MIKFKEVLAVFDELSNSRTFANFFRVQESFKNRIAFETIKEDKKIKVTYKEYTKNAIKKSYIVKTTLNDLPKGSYVLLKQPNSIEWCVNFWAIILAGYNPVLADFRFTKEEVAYAIDQTKAQAIITNDPNDYGITKISTDIGDGEEYDYDSESMGTSLVFCTSGTTERFKLFEYNEKAIFAQILNALDIVNQNFAFSQGNKPCNVKNLGFLPFSHIFGFIAVFIWYTAFGGTVIFPEENTAESILYACRKLKVTHIYVVPMFWNHVVKSIKAKLENGTDLEKKFINKAINQGYEIQSDPAKPNLKKAKANAKFVQKTIFGTHVEFMISGGGYIPEETLRILNAMGYPLHNGFGMTEAGVTCVETATDMPTRIKGYIGKPFGSCEFKIGDNDELFIRGASTYSARIIDGVRYEKPADQWFATGDKVAVEDGRYKIVGRIKELIIGASGENINPNTLELKFENLPYVQHYCIIGLPHGDYEDIALVVQLNKNINEFEIKQLMDEINERNQDLQVYEKVNATYIIDENEHMFGINKIPRVKIKNLFINKPSAFTKLDGSMLKVSKEIPAELRELADQIKAMVANVLSISVDIVKDDSDFINDLGGDSFGYVSLLLGIEEKFGIKINDDYYTKCTNLYDLVHLIDKAIKEQQNNQ